MLQYMLFSYINLNWSFIIQTFILLGGLVLFLNILGFIGNIIAVCNDEQQVKDIFINILKANGYLFLTIGIILIGFNILLFCFILMNYFN